MSSMPRHWLRCRNSPDAVARKGVMRLSRLWRWAHPSVTVAVLRLRQGWIQFHDPAAGALDALLFVIEENPRPRDTGTFSVYCRGNLVVRSETVNLLSDDPAPILGLLRTYSAQLRVCSHRAVRFKNISPWLKNRILEEMRDLQIPV